MHKTLYFQVIIAILAGIGLGWAFPEIAVLMKPLADAFIKLIKMMISPVIFCTVVTGIAGMGAMREAGRVGIKALIYFEVMTTLALFIGLAVAHLWQPGAGMHIDPASLDSKAIETYAGKAAQQKGAVDFVLNIIPNTITDAFVRGDMLQVLLVAIFFACGLMAVGERGQPIYNFIQQLSEVLFKIIGFIVRLAPLGAFGAMAFTVGKYGVGTLGSLASLMLGFYATCFLFIFLVLGAVMRLTGFRLWPFLKYIKEEILVVLGTSSSEAALPGLMQKLTRLGCGRSVVNMVVPTGYSFNLDGTCIYLTMAALFIAQALDIEMTFAQELTLITVLLLTSKGAAGVTGSGFIVLAGTLSAVGHVPVEGLALILGIDRFMSEARAITNLIGNGVATLVVAKWEGALDLAQANREAPARSSSPV
jgi:aerobic C4-dicarboxylate transport protein